MVDCWREGQRGREEGREEGREVCWGRREVMVGCSVMLEMVEMVETCMRVLVVMMNHIMC